jgi:hypothetical protein
VRGRVEVELMSCIDCQDPWTHARGRCSTCYARAIRTGEITALYAKVSAHEALLMRCLRDEGLSLGEVAEAVGRGVATVHRHVGTS